MRGSALSGIGMEACDERQSPSSVLCILVHLMLPDTLLDLTADEAISYATVLAVMATCDGEFSPVEMSAYESRVASLLYQRDVRERLESVVGEWVDIDFHLQALSETGIKLLLRDVVMMAACDGEYTEEEMKIIDKVAAAAEVGEEELNQLYHWVYEGWSWFQRGHQILSIDNPDGAERVDGVKGPTEPVG